MRTPLLGLPRIHLRTRRGGTLAVRKRGVSGTKVSRLSSSDQGVTGSIILRLEKEGDVAKDRAIVLA